MGKKHKQRKSNDIPVFNEEYMNNNKSTNRNGNEKKKSKSNKLKNSKYSHSHSNSKSYHSENEFIYYLKELKYNNVNGFELYTMLSDGNCMFHSISHQMNYIVNNYQLHTNTKTNTKTTKSVYTHINVRHRVCEYISNHQDYFALFLDLEEESFKQYVKRMRYVTICTYDWG